MSEQALVLSQLALAAFTTLATGALVWVTYVLAVETKRMAKAGSQPHVVATIEPNEWSVIHADLKVANVGNAPAYSVKLQFDPPLPTDRKPEKRPIPLQNISVLKPGQQLSSYLSEYRDVAKRNYRVTISWSREQASRTIETMSYDLNMNDYEGSSWLGARSPLNQLADEVKKIREELSRVLSGFRHLSVDVFTERNRERRRQDDEHRFAEIQSREEAATAGHENTTPDHSRD